MNPRSLLSRIAEGVSLLTGLALAVATAGCARELQRPPCDRPDLGGCHIEDIDIEGARVVDEDDIQERIATAETSRLLGGALRHVPVLRALDAVSVEYERFDRFVLERDLARIERYYRARGFYGASVRAARVQRVEDDEGGAVRVEIVVEEGAPVEVGALQLTPAQRAQLFQDNPACLGDLGGEPVRVEWKDWTLERGRDVLGPVTEAKDILKPGARFEEEQYEETKKQILRALTDRGFPYASVEGSVCVDLVGRKAQVIYRVALGPESKYGPIRIEGLGELPERPLRAALKIEEGERFSTEALEQAERALSEFGVFGAVGVEIHRSPEGQPQNPVVPVTFHVQPAALRAVRLGGGAELGGRAEAHLVAGWEDRNFLGGLRRFTIEARPGIVLYPTNFSTIFDAPPTRILPEVQLRSELRQPAAIEARTTAVLRGAARIYRLQTGQFNVEDVLVDGEENIVGYREYAGAIGLERPFLGGDVLNVALFENLQLNDPFSYNRDDPPQGFRQLFLPYLQSVITLDLRRDARGKPTRVEPHKGVWMQLDAQLAGYLFGDADDVRLQPEFRAYIPISKRVTLGMRLLFGLLFPRNYGQAFVNLQDECLQAFQTSGTVSADCAALASDLQLLQFRAFFSGGPNSNRGYNFNDVGPHGAVPSLTGVRDEIVPTGGLSLWESSVELRIPISGDFGTTLFVDGSDITRGVSSFRLTRPHLSAGAGLRYATPIGPLRVDVGYRIPCAQVLGVCPGEAMPTDEGEPQLVLGLPIAVSIAIGEAF